MKHETCGGSDVHRMVNERKQAAEKGKLLSHRVELKDVFFVERIAFASIVRASIEKNIFFLFPLVTSLDVCPSGHRLQQWQNTFLEPKKGRKVLTSLRRRKKKENFSPFTI